MLFRFHQRSTDLRRASPERRFLAFFLLKGQGLVFCFGKWLVIVGGLGIGKHVVSHFPGSCGCLRDYGRRALDVPRRSRIRCLQLAASCIRIPGRSDVCLFAVSWLAAIFSPTCYPNAADWQTNENEYDCLLSVFHLIAHHQMDSPKKKHLRSSYHVFARSCSASPRKINFQKLQLSQNDCELPKINQTVPTDHKSPWKKKMIH